MLFPGSVVPLAMFGRLFETIVTRQRLKASLSHKHLQCGLEVSDSVLLSKEVSHWKQMSWPNEIYRTFLPRTSKDWKKPQFLEHLGIYNFCVVWALITTLFNTASFPIFVYNADHFTKFCTIWFQVMKVHKVPHRWFLWNQEDPWHMSHCLFTEKHVAPSRLTSGGNMTSGKKGFIWNDVEPTNDVLIQ